MNAPIKITYQQILAHKPCADGFARLLHGRGLLDDEGSKRWSKNRSVGLPDFPDLPTEPWSLAEALDSNNLEDVLWCLRCLPEHENLWRKLSVSYAADVRRLMQNAQSLNALRVAWLYSDGLATEADLAAARAGARLVLGAAVAVAVWSAAASWAASWAAAWSSSSSSAAALAADAVADADEDATEMRHKQTARLRAILEAGEWVGPCPVQDLIDSPALCGVDE